MNKRQARILLKMIVVRTSLSVSFVCEAPSRLQLGECQLLIRWASCKQKVRNQWGSPPDFCLLTPDS